MSLRSFRCHSNDIKRNPWVICVPISQLMTHPAIYRPPFTLQLCCKPVVILQRVTKDQKVHMSTHDGLQKLHNIDLALHRSHGLSRKDNHHLLICTSGEVRMKKVTSIWRLQWVSERYHPPPPPYFSPSFWYSPFNIFLPFFQSDLWNLKTMV